MQESPNSEVSKDCNEPSLDYSSVVERKTSLEIGHLEQQATTSFWSTIGHVQRLLHSRDVYGTKIGRNIPFRFRSHYTHRALDHCRISIVEAYLSSLERYSTIFPNPKIFPRNGHKRRVDLQDYSAHVAGLRAQLNESWGETNRNKYP